MGEQGNEWFRRPVGRTRLQRRARARRAEILSALSAGFEPDVVAEMFGTSELAICMVRDESLGFVGLISIAKSA